LIHFLSALLCSTAVALLRQSRLGPSTLPNATIRPTSGATVNAIKLFEIVISLLYATGADEFCMAHPVAKIKNSKVEKMDRVLTGFLCIIFISNLFLTVYRNTV
jgi:hypothetical protein